MRNSKPLSELPDPADLELHAINTDPGLVTRRLRELVPLLEFIDARVLTITAEATVLAAPLLVSAMNQNGTHQASIFYLLADYAVGVAMFGALPGVYVTGVHDRCEALPVQYWLKRGEVRHLAPGTGSLRIEVRLAPADVAAMRTRLIDKGRAECTGIARFYQEGTLVADAEHTMGIYADLPRAAGRRANLFQVQNLKVSAMMIAGLRTDALSTEIAQEHGRAIAQRMSVVTPQLPALVRARTEHLNHVLSAHGREMSQILVLAVGLDPKPSLFAGLGPRWFGVDLKEMLAERGRRFARFGSPEPTFTGVPADLRCEGWDAALAQAGFDSQLPTLVIIEGLSMYLNRDEFAALLRTLRRVSTSPHTRIWVDHVTENLFALTDESVRAFLSSMARLGEPFQLGFSDIQSIDDEGWRCASQTAAAKFVDDADPVFREYRFSVLAPA